MSQAKVWVAYVSPDAQFHIALDFVAGMSAAEAILRSNIQAQTELPEPLNLGVFGVKVAADYVLQAGDRVEIYRPLTINPKDIRRKRAAENPVGIYQRGNRFKQSES